MQTDKSKQLVAEVEEPVKLSNPLSSEFLSSRGTCCGNGCKECPYYPRHTAGTRTKN
jgi:hypothetical protein